MINICIIACLNRFLKKAGPGRGLRWGDADHAPAASRRGIFRVSGVWWVSKGRGAMSFTLQGELVECGIIVSISIREFCH